MDNLVDYKGPQRRRTRRRTAGHTRSASRERLRRWAVRRAQSPDDIGVVHRQVALDALVVLDELEAQERRLVRAS